MEILERVPVPTLLAPRHIHSALFRSLTTGRFSKFAILPFSNQVIIDLTKRESTMSSMIQEYRHKPSKEEMDAVFGLCRNNHWSSCLQCLQRSPQIGEEIMIMVRFVSLCCNESRRRYLFSVLLPYIHSLIHSLIHSFLHLAFARRIITLRQLSSTKQSRRRETSKSEPV